MKYWHEVIAKYNNPQETYDKRKEGKYLQSIVIILLMYLSRGKDYPYNIAKTFRSIDGLNLQGIKLLSHASKLSSLLLKMKKDGLLIQVPDTIHLKERTYYELNPIIISSPVFLLSDRDHMNKEKSFEIPIDMIKIFLSWLTESNKKEEIESWSQIKRFDFLTFIMFLQRKAKEWEELKEKTGTSINASRNQKSREKMSELLKEYMIELENVSGPTKDYRKDLNEIINSTKMPILFLKDTREP